MKKLNLTLLATAIPMAMSVSQAQDVEVEVLHWWTAGGEAKALNVLKEDLESQGIAWADMPVAGGGGSEAMTVLRARVQSGNPPTAVQMLGFDIKDWAREGVLADLNSAAEEENWGDVIPAALQEFAKHDGKWIAAPVNVHSTNWVWANQSIMEEIGVEAPPEDWESFMSALQAAQDAGYIALAHGGQPWQDATLFDSTVLSAGGPEFYKKAMIELDPEALGSETMVEAFSRLRQLREFVDSNFSGREWNAASNMVINGEAAFQIMGDWAKGEFVASDMTPGEDYACFRVPGTKGSVTFNSDMFAMFDGDEVNKDAQIAMAKAIESPEFQSAFNVVKGSVPARTDVSNEAFDACGKKAMEQLAEAAENDTLMGSMAHGYAAPSAVKNAVFDVVTNFFNSSMPAEDAAEQLSMAVESANR